tara:strand:+ start:128 stop:1228 length:1101 start_codon:yes stop_codon:yes gene_type:complete
MKIGVLTSSRADYGIYLPLLQKLKTDSFFELEIIVFGTHLSEKHGYTLADIEKDSYRIIHKIKSLVDDDSQKSIAISYGNTILKFSDFWDNHSYDLVLCLGDRFEMSAAVQASIPFGLKLAHIHGGETTLGATDNIYRHQITLVSKIHFTSTKGYKFRVTELVESDKNVFDVGALSLSNIEEFTPINKKEFYSRFKIKDAPYCLITFHPETNAFGENKNYAIEMRKALEFASTKINLVITMPNADNMGSVYREQLYLLKETMRDQVLLIENFGKESYFSAMYYAGFLLGNTSSGIIEAASFNKYVVNVGDRQKGRVQSRNIIDSKFNAVEIIKAFDKCLKSGIYKGENIYFKADSVKKIIQIINKL